MKITMCLCILLLQGILPGTTAAEGTDSTMLTVDRIFHSREFFSRGAGPVQWIDGGAGYTALERSASREGGRDLVRYETATGARTILVPSERLVPPGSSSPLAVEHYAWSPGNRYLLIFTNSRRVWRLNTRGDYWILNVADGKLKRLGGDAPPSSLMFATFSPDGSRVAYVRGNNLYVEDVEHGGIVQLTADGSATVINGTFDWVYEEEFALHDGFRWSPDGTHIAYWQLDASGVRDFLLINDTDSLYSYVIPVQYPKVGTTLSACRVGVVSASGGPTTWLATEGDPRNTYIPRMDWAGNSGDVAFQYMNRLQNANRLMLADSRTGSLRTVLTDSDSTWVEAVDDIHWLEQGKVFTWLSEEDGWKHLYLYDRGGKKLRLLTPGAFDIERVVQADPAGGWVYYIASPDNPCERYLYRLSLNGEGKTGRITPGGEPGTHSYNISPDGRWAFHTYSRFAEPSVTELVQLPEHRVIRVIDDHAALKRSLARLKRGEASFFRVDIGRGVLLDGWKMLPPDFDPSKKYPVLEMIYGEPAGQTVAD
ncbi:MAG TPA: DPP IV N-terminal domain-containing protein, partial [Bacteroidota bacterium]|nr:DPP IV N-terminal domain-containing protein [Bacteroidota bacterium]